MSSASEINTTIGHLTGTQRAQLRHKRPHNYTAEEMKAMAKCSMDTIARFLPVSATLGALAFYGVEFGYLRPHPRFGSTMTVLTASLLGYCVVTLGSTTRCEDRFMRLRNSTIGAKLRADHEAKRKEFTIWSPPASVDLYRPYPATETVNSINDEINNRLINIFEEPPSAMNTDDYKSYVDVDWWDGMFSSQFSQESSTAVIEPKHRSLTYEELRKQSRAVKTTMFLLERRSKARLRRLGDQVLEQQKDL